MHWGPFAQAGEGLALWGLFLAKESITVLCFLVSFLCIVSRLHKLAENGNHKHSKLVENIIIDEKCYSEQVSIEIFELIMKCFSDRICGHLRRPIHSSIMLQVLLTHGINDQLGIKRADLNQAFLSCIPVPIAEVWGTDRQKAYYLLIGYLFLHLKSSMVDKKGTTGKDYLHFQTFVGNPEIEMFPWTVQIEDCMEHIDTHWLRVSCFTNTWSSTFSYGVLYSLLIWREFVNRLSISKYISTCSAFVDTDYSCLERHPVDKAPFAKVYYL